MTDDLAERLDAVERALTDGDTAVDDLSDSGDIERRLDDLEARAETVDDRLAELEAAVQAVRGYVGGIRAVNRDVEQRADAALAVAESVAEAVEDDSLDNDSFDDLDLSEADENGVVDGTKGGDDSHAQTTRDDLVSRLRRVL